MGFRACTFCSLEWFHAESYRGHAGASTYYLQYAYLCRGRILRGAVPEQRSIALPHPLSVGRTGWNSIKITGQGRPVFSTGFLACCDEMVFQKMDLASSRFSLRG